MCVCTRARALTYNWRASGNGRNRLGMLSGPVFYFFLSILPRRRCTRPCPSTPPSAHSGTGPTETDTEECTNGLCWRTRALACTSRSRRVARTNRSAARRGRCKRQIFFRSHNTLPPWSTHRLTEHDRNTTVQ